jgi:hypothetical protein
MASKDPEIADVDDSILRDLESKYATMRCPVHDVPPEFEVAPDGAVIERFCCEALSQIFRELQATEAAGAAIAEDDTEPVAEGGPRAR